MLRASTNAPALPTGTVTFVLTDIEGSTQLVQALGDRYGDLLADHCRIVRDAISAAGGIEVSTEGDSFFAVFATPSAAGTAAVAAQRALAAHAWPEEAEVRVRMGLHTGEGTRGGDNYMASTSIEPRASRPPRNSEWLPISARL